MGFNKRIKEALFVHYAWNIKNMIFSHISRLKIRNMLRAYWAAEIIYILINHQNSLTAAQQIHRSIWTCKNCTCIAHKCQTHIKFNETNNIDVRLCTYAQYHRPTQRALAGQILCKVIINTILFYCILLAISKNLTCFL